MAKRTRGSTSRPGQRRPIQRPAARPAIRPVSPVASVASPTSVEPRPDELTDAEEARAAQLEAAIVAEERQAEASKRRTRAARAVDPDAVRTTTTLSVSAAEEYAYVARDVKRIAILGGALTLILLALWALSHIAGVGIL
jgi:hypothetical protein